MGEVRTIDRRGNLKGLRLIIAGGGTGGHIFPGLAVGKELIKRHPGSEILFVTGYRRIEDDILREAGINRVPITVEGIKGRGLRGTIRSAVKLPLGFLQSILIIRRFSPDFVLGVGGYSAGPVCLAARLMGVRTAIHEQNSFPGITNRLLARVVDRVFISFEESGSHFPKDKVRLTGDPVREEFLGIREGNKGRTGGFTILVTGGSQGASAINRTFIKALKKIKDMGRTPRVIHQTGQADYESAVEGYREMGIEADVRPFINDMHIAYRQADIVIGRSGAGTVFELAAMGKPSILIPFPQAADDHQTANARMLAHAGGAIIIPQDELDPDRLAGVLTGLMDDSPSLEKMAELALKTARPEAAKDIADGIEEMIGIKL
ncbi:MAG: undecaprenyldiphospho-muramoylpentapeptide beta-N-acetylglucosaminyltransferase [Deltaproteobacteria bacterium]|nr:undecaprenyldiphospho-muramoylpentapeptide beta-N-acetylglucosaminyltransferase [Deltaproteobacteria bacterium]